MDRYVMAVGAASQEVEDRSKAKVFISYSRKDIEFADRLDAALKARGFEPLIDRTDTDIHALEQCWDRIKALISRADTVVFVISPDAVASEIALKEIAEAASLNKRFVPVVWRWVTDKLIPTELAKLNFIAFDAAVQFEQRADQLAEALNTDIGWIRQHTDFGEQARRWAQAKGASGLLLRSPVLEQAERWIASRPPLAPVPTEETQAFIRDSRQGATRRRNVLTGSLAAGLVLALALAGVEYWQRGIAVHQTQVAEERQQFAEQQQTVAEQQRQIAVEQRTIAQQNEAQAKTERDNAARNFKLAQNAAESLVFVAQKLRDVQGMTAEGVRKILETARTNFEQLAASAPDDLTLQRSRSVMLDEFGDTYRTLGDLEQALQAHRDALAIFERLAATDRSDTAWQRDLSVSYERIGDVLVVQGKLDEALQAYRDSLTIAERLVAVDRSNTQWQRDLSVAYNKVGDVVEAQGKLDDALKTYRNAVSIRERLAAGDRSNTNWQHDLAVSYSKIGDVMVKQARIEDARTSYRKALGIMEPLTAADPANVQWQVDIIDYNRNLAINGDDPARRFAFIVSALRKLQILTTLTDEQKGWLAEAEKQVSKPKQSKARP
jgi:tetratricopeptide (TPR) repeat protein